METGLALGNKSDSGFAFVSAGDETTVDGGLAHLALLGSLPSIGVREDELYVVLDGFPDDSAAGVCFDDE